MFDNRCEYFHPVLFQRCVSIGRNRYFTDITANALKSNQSLEQIRDKNNINRLFFGWYGLELRQFVSTRGRFIPWLLWFFGHFDIHLICSSLASTFRLDFGEWLTTLFRHLVVWVELKLSEKMTNQSPICFTCLSSNMWYVWQLTDICWHSLSDRAIHLRHEVVHRCHRSQHLTHHSVIPYLPSIGTAVKRQMTRASHTWPHLSCHCYRHWNQASQTQISRSSGCRGDRKQR